MAIILIVDQDIEFAELVRDGLRERKYVAEAVYSARDALSYLERNPVDIVVAHVHLSEVSGLELVSRLRDRHSETLGIVVTSHGSMDTAIRAIRAGAYDYISKPVTIAALEVAIARAVGYQALRREVQELRLTVSAARPVDTIVGDSPPIREVTSMIRRVAGSDATVLITGESGTGKELVARAIHDLSERCHLPFVAVNCAALPPALLESELFGHVRGAFTDARENRHGLFVQAGGGTLFLDEIGEMPLDMQVKLLRVLQERMLRPVGADLEVPFAARLITATNRDLEESRVARAAGRLAGIIATIGSGLAQPEIRRLYKDVFKARVDRDALVPYVHLALAASTRNADGGMDAPLTALAETSRGSLLGAADVMVRSVPGERSMAPSAL